MKLYRDFSLGERFLFWFSKGLLMPLYAMLMMVGGVFIIDWLYFTINEDGQSNFSYMLGISNWIGIIFFHAILALFLYLGIVQIKDTLSTKRQVREMEEIFDKNGGFFWSE
jgi:membrane protein implicated in regulation of membrane protease activity